MAVTTVDRPARAARARPVRGQPTAQMAAPPLTRRTELDTAVSRGVKLARAAEALGPLSVSDAVVGRRQEITRPAAAVSAADGQLAPGAAIPAVAPPSACVESSGRVAAGIAVDPRGSALRLDPRPATAVRPRRVVSWADRLDAAAERVPRARGRALLPDGGVGGRATGRADSYLPSA
jgi:hypothetical protein